MEIFERGLQLDPRIKSRDTKSRTNIKNPTRPNLHIVPQFKNWWLFLPAPIVNGGGDRLGKVQFSELQKPRDLGLGHTAYRRASLTDLYIPTKFHWNQKNFLWMDGRTDIPTDGHFRRPLILLG